MLKQSGEAGLLCCAVSETQDSNDLLTIAQVVRQVVAAVSVLRGHMSCWC